MLPFINVFGVEISTYYILIGVGLIAAMLIYRWLSGTTRLSDKAFRLYGFILIISIILGFVSAWLFQGIYDLVAMSSSKWKGITFLGGLFGGALIFLVLSLIFAKGETLKELWKVVCIAPLSITAAHSLGRLGCFCAGCCYGKPTKSFLGVVFIMSEKNGHVLPTQLFESIFLAILFALLLLLVLKFKKYSLTMIIYMFAYSVFRFVLEFFRGDEERSVSGVLSPSQWLSIVMFMGAVALCVYIFAFKRIPFNGKKTKLSFKELCNFLHKVD